MSKYDFYSHVRYSECGEDGRLSLGAVVDYFQDTATFQGEHLGIGVSYLKKQHIAWILTSWQIITDHFPKLAEPVTVRTWAYDFRSFYGLRNLLLLDGSGQPAAWANSVWVLMDMERMRPVKVPQKLLDLYGTDPALEPPQGRGTRDGRGDGSIPGDKDTPGHEPSCEQRPVYRDGAYVSS